MSEDTVPSPAKMEMETSPLLRLSGELRNRIYEYALTVRKVPYVLRPDDSRPRLYHNSLNSQPASEMPALIETCRHIRNEALPFFLSNRIELRIQPPTYRPGNNQEDILEAKMSLINRRLTDWIRSLGEGRIQWLTRLELVLTGFHAYPMDTPSDMLDRDPNLEYAERCLVHLQKHCTEHLRLPARLRIDVDFTYGFLVEDDITVDVVASLDFNAASCQAMRDRVYDTAQTMERRARQLSRRPSTDPVCQLWNLCRIQRSQDYLLSMVEDLDCNSEWLWMA